MTVRQSSHDSVSEEVHWTKLIRVADQISASPGRKQDTAVV